MDANRLPFLIYTPERTGSTTLARLLNCHPAIRCELEPFNPGYDGPAPYLCQTLLKSQGLAAAVQALWGYLQCNGFKHVRHADGWPFAGQPELNDWLLVNATASVILLHRGNALRRAISGQISAQMRVWVPLTHVERQRIRDHLFAPLDIAQLRAEIIHERAAYGRSRELLADSGKPWREVAYEDFFAPHLTLAARFQAVWSVLEFLGLGPVAEPQRLSAMEWLFDPANTGFQNAAAYERIPNIHQVERELGCAENGFVFDDRRDQQSSSSSSSSSPIP